MLHVRRESISHYLEKHIRYPTWKSDEWLKWKLGHSRNAPTGELFKDRLRVRQWCGETFWPRLPMRSLWRFIYMYFFRLRVPGRPSRVAPGRAHGVLRVHDHAVI